MQGLAVGHFKPKDVVIWIKHVPDLVHMDHGCICDEFLILFQLVTLLTLDSFVDILTYQFAGLTVSDLGAFGSGRASVCETV